MFHSILSILYVVMVGAGYGVSLNFWLQYFSNCDPNGCEQFAQEVVILSSLGATGFVFFAIGVTYMIFALIHMKAAFGAVKNDGYTPLTGSEEFGDQKEAPAPHTAYAQPPSYSQPPSTTSQPSYQSQTAYAEAPSYQENPYPQPPAPSSNGGGATLHYDNEFTK